MDDRALVERQLGRPPRAFRRVAIRCPYGAPAVTEQEPYDERGEPFPTTYYLTCPHLVASVARIEAGGGVERWSSELEHDPALAADLARATGEQRSLRIDLARGRTGRDGGASLELGIGGSRNPARLKCLHAHAAYALARPGYRLGERVLAELAELWPETAAAPAAPTSSMADPVSEAPATAAEVESARREWEEGHRRIEEEKGPDHTEGERLQAHVEAVTEELRRRVGGTFTLAELTRAYAGAEGWSRAAVAERSPQPGWPRTLSIVEATAFHRYARGASDYEP